MSGAPGSGGGEEELERRLVEVLPAKAKGVKDLLQAKGWVDKDCGARGGPKGEGEGGREVVRFVLSGAADARVVGDWDGVLRVVDRACVALKAAKQQQQGDAPSTAGPPADSAGCQGELAPDSFWGCGEVGTLDLSDAALHPTAAARSTALRRCFARGVPVLIRGLPFGDSLRLWASPAHFERTCASSTVAAQVCPQAKIDLAGHRAKNTKGNFSFHEMPLAELVRRCGGDASLAPVVGPGEKYYLRSVPPGRLKAGSHFPSIFPEIAADFPLAAICREVEAPAPRTPPLRYHSSALRITSPSTELWTHYDTLPNLLCQVASSKTCTVWPPAAEPFLYVEGSSSRVDDIHDPDLSLYPRFRQADAMRLEVELEPGCALFIPPLWFHHTLSAPGGCSVAVNIFFADPSAEPLYHGKDFYGNKDLPLGVKAIENAERYVAAPLLRVPQPFRAFYALRAAELVLQRGGARGAPAYCGGKKVAVVTGGTGGIGAEIVKALLSPEAGYHVAVVSRKREAEVPLGAVVRVADLSSGESVRALTESLRREFPGGVDLLVNAAAVCSRARVLTQDGIELQFAVNTLSYHRLILGITSFSSRLPTVVNLASSWARDLDLSDFNYESRKYSGIAAYTASKQADRILTRAWAKRIPGLTINACHPGAVHGTALSGALKLAPESATHTAPQAAALPVQLATAAVTGRYFAGGADAPNDDAQWQDLEEPLMALLDALT
ncbi:tRNA wybutosine-synthesizing protein 4 [Diplonema papillatum]|nr:tRNA wybutosine-synthesizing protein 4 [Diplonema papillatum]